MGEVGGPKQQIAANEAAGGREAAFDELAAQEKDKAGVRVTMQSLPRLWQTVDNAWVASFIHSQSSIAHGSFHVRLA